MPPYCSCASEDDYQCPTQTHENCDDKCDALQNPVTLEETQAALEHWRDHGFLSGCSHGH